jgi:DNA-binding transcriptional regulator WhiA
LGSACCVHAELSALLNTAGVLTWTAAGAPRLRVESKHPAAVRRAETLVEACFGVSLSDQSEDDARRVLAACGLLGGAEDRPAPVRSACCKRAFLRGAFLGGGSCASPEKGYHLEIVSADPALAQTLLTLLEGLRIPGRFVERKGQAVVYLKEAERIVELLSLLSASAARCELENIRIYKDVRNQANRAANCDNANLDKTLDAAARQLLAIECLERDHTLEALPEPLQEIARRRKQHPEMSLTELGRSLNPPVGKSGVNHRLRRLEEIAQESENCP